MNQITSVIGDNLAENVVPNDEPIKVGNDKLALRVSKATVDHLASKSFETDSGSLSLRGIDSSTTSFIPPHEVLEVKVDIIILI